MNKQCVSLNETPPSINAQYAVKKSNGHNQKGVKTTSTDNDEILILSTIYKFFHK